MSKTITGSFKKYNDTISYKITEGQQEKIIRCLMKYYIKYCHDGEGIMQDDDAQIYAPNTLAEICDKYITFKENNK